MPWSWVLVVEFWEVSYCIRGEGGIKKKEGERRGRGRRGRERRGRGGERKVETG